jgi:hypothetical protein
MKYLKFKSTVPVSSKKLYEWHENKGAFSRLQPPWEKIEILQFPERLENEAVAKFKIHNGPISLIWEALHFEVKRYESFSDRQIKGPFKEWEHLHAFEKIDVEEARLSDQIQYKLPGGFLGEAVAGRFVENKIRQMFAFRHRIMCDDFNRYGKTDKKINKTVLITGRSGLIGKSLSVLLTTLGYEVRGLSRNPKESNDYFWNPASGEMDINALVGVDAVVHLAGENIAGGLWTARRKESILKSRVDGTRLLVEKMSEVENPPSVFICASGINFYGSGHADKDESSPKGNGFLSDVCEAWEAEANKIEQLNVRLTIIRTGIVLSPQGGALSKMLLPFKLGLGGRVGSGKQRMAWIGLEDLLDVYVHAINNVTFSGVVNAVVPEAIEQRTFAKTLGKVLKRPTIAPLPASAVKSILGKMGEETLLIDLPVHSAKLKELKFHFRHPVLEDYLRFTLGENILL